MDIQRMKTGETYGPAIENMFPPDLMLAIGEDNIQGYVKLSESAGKVNHQKRQKH